MRFTHDLPSLPREIRDDVAKALQSAGRVAEQHSRNYSGFAGFVVKSATRAQLVSPTHLRITNDNPVAHYLEDGTKPHVIEARRAPRLVFRVDGRLIATRKVNHPGNRAHQFVQGAAEAAADHFVEEFET